MRRSRNRKNLTRAQLARIASSEVRWGLRASRAMRYCGGGAREKCGLAMGAPFPPQETENTA